MVPIDQPSWSLKILEDFIINSQNIKRNRRDLNPDVSSGDFQRHINELKKRYLGEKNGGVKSEKNQQFFLIFMSRNTNICDACGEK